MANRKNVSATNMIEAKDGAAKTPIAKAASATVTGALGHALAAHILQRAEDKGREELGERESYKDILRKLWNLPEDADHIAFRNDLDAAMDAINKKVAEANATAKRADKDAPNISLNDWCLDNPVDNSIRTYVSRFRKMSQAVQAGFRDHMVEISRPWNEIEKAATAHLNSIAATNGGGTGNPRQRGKGAGAGRKPTPVLDKVKAFTKTNLLDEKTHAVKPDVKLYQVIGLMLQQATVEQCNEVLAEVQRIRDLKIKVEEDMRAKKEKESENAKALAEQSKGNAGQSGTTATGATVKVTKAKGSRKGAPAPTNA